MNKHNWTYKKFEDCLVKAPKAKQVQTSEYNSGSKYPIISQEDRMISGYCDDSSLLYHIDSPVVIFGDHTRVLKYVDFDFVVGADGVKILIPKDFLKAKFLLYYLRWYQVPNHGYSRHYKLLKEIVLSFPPVEEQERIVAELDLLSSIIDKKKAQLQEYDRLAQSIFYSMFGDPITNEKGWEVKRIEEIGKCVSGGTPSRRFPEYFTGNINWYSAGELNRLFLKDSIEKITEEALNNSSAKLCPPYSLFIGMYDTAAFKLGIPSVESTSNQACTNVTLYDDNVIWLYYTLLFMRDEALKHRHGARQKNLTLGYIKNFTVPLPPLSLQQEFAEKVEAIERQKALVRASIVETETLFNSRMDYYFN